MHDIGRSYVSYFTEWYWVMVSGYLKDQDGVESLLALNLGDGLQSNFLSPNKSSTDFLTLNGTHHKLDRTMIQYNPKNLMENHYFETVRTDMNYPGVECSLAFESKKMVKNG